MLRTYLRKHLRKNDEAISPVIGTILMVAATVIIAGAIYAAINSYSSRANKSSVDATFRVQSVDTDGDGITDSIKIGYLSGPDGAHVTYAIYQLDGTKINGTATGGAYPYWTGHPGDFVSYNPANAGTYSVSVLIGDQTFVDQQAQVQQ